MQPSVPKRQATIHRPRRSLNSLFLTLGASYDEVYFADSRGELYGGRLREKYTVDELQGWADSLYRKALAYHPDRFPGVGPSVKKYYNNLFKERTSAYQHIKEILNHG